MPSSRGISSRPGVAAALAEGIGERCVVCSAAERSICNEHITNTARTIYAKLTFPSIWRASMHGGGPDGESAIPANEFSLDANRAAGNV